MRPLTSHKYCWRTRILRSSQFVYTPFVLGVALSLAGCVSSIIPSLREPARLYDTQTEISEIQKQLAPIGWGMDASLTAEQRNNYVTLRMYAVDQNYTIYESQLTHEAQETGLAASLINLGLTGAGSVAPTAVVGKALSAAATGFTGASQAYDKDVLLAQSIQNLETQMRADRNAKAATILTSMRCPISSYNMGMVLSDLEEYYRAGTMPNALIAITKTVGNAESQAKDSKASANPATQIQMAGAERLAQPRSIETQPINLDEDPHCRSLAVAIASNTGQSFPSKRPAREVVTPGPGPGPGPVATETCASLAQQLMANEGNLGDEKTRKAMAQIALKRHKMRCPPA